MVYGNENPNDFSGAAGDFGRAESGHASSFGGFGGLRDSGPARQGLERFLRHSWTALLALGIVALVVGLVMLVWPGHTTLVLAFLFGIYLVVSGLAQISFGIVVHFGMAGKALTILGGVISLVAGILALVSHPSALFLLGAFIGISWLFAGFTRLGLLPAADSPGRGLAIVSGVLWLLGGIVLIVSPGLGLVTLAIVSGALLLVTGIIVIAQALALRRALQRF
ncbi:HdeD family acid-resistance protein [Dietzia sp.]|uniref:HdeD family acid-resistance protein n=1 Tax=Dietzia sp. TaxID=1871616 RepID=UPI002FDB03FC